MFDMERLFDLLDEARYAAATCKCPTTTKAYLNMARLEGLWLYHDADDEDDERKIRAAGTYAAGLIATLTWSEKSFTAARHAQEFWRGFEDGLYERTESAKASTAFRRGYRFGRHGH